MSFNWPPDLDMSRNLRLDELLDQISSDGTSQVITQLGPIVTGRDGSTQMLLVAQDPYC